jgi:hypothetical protein
VILNDGEVKKNLSIFPNTVYNLYMSTRPTVDICKHCNLEESHHVYGKCPKTFTTPDGKQYTRLIDSSWEPDGIAYVDQVPFSEEHISGSNL